MALYAIGDVQGCFAGLQRLLDKLRFDPACDRLWFTGDLVNRGPQSLATLRYVAGLGSAAITVLGNHDLHLLAVACGATAQKKRDTLADVLAAPDREPLLHWLRQRPLLHHDATLDWTLLHAGLIPQWDLPQALANAAEIEVALRGTDPAAFLRTMYGDAPDRWTDDLSPTERRRFIVNVFTRVRFCDADGRIDLTHKGAPGSQPPPWQPWFSWPARRTRHARVVFGHWSALGLYQSASVLGLDTGCVWGGSLTAVRLDGADRIVVSVPCEPQQPTAT